jgi:hypothetical protein
MMGHVGVQHTALGHACCQRQLTGVIATAWRTAEIHAATTGAVHKQLLLLLPLLPLLHLRPLLLLLCAVLGGGYIALEFSGIFQRFGSEVHTVFRQPLPLRGFDEEVGAPGGFWACCWVQAVPLLSSGYVQCLAQQRATAKLSQVDAAGHNTQRGVSDLRLCRTAAQQGSATALQQLLLSLVPCQWCASVPAAEPLTPRKYTCACIAAGS